MINNRELSTRIERLSSGLRINRAADDAAGLSVSEGMRAELVGFRQAVRNAEHGTNLIQTAEGALNEVSAILSTSLASATTGVVDASITGAASGTYTFIDNSASWLTLTDWVSN